MHGKLLETFFLMLMVILNGCKIQGNINNLESAIPLSQSASPNKSEVDLKKLIDYVPSPSATRPCLPESNDYSFDNIPSLLQEAESLLNSMTFSEIISDDYWLISLPKSSNIMFFYLPSLPEVEAEIPVIIGGFGYGPNVSAFFGIFSFEDKQWKSQRYPQASLEIAKNRVEILTQGRRCGGRLVEIRRQGDLLAFIFDLFVGTKVAQEVHLLTYKDGKWEVLWVPTYTIEEVRWTSRVQFLEPNGIETFMIQRRDMDTNRKWQEIWRLEGTRYINASIQN